MTKPRKLYVLLDGFMRALRPCPAFTAPTSSALNMTFPAITNPGRLVFLLSPSGRLAEEIAPPPRRRTKRRGRHPHNALSPAFVRTAPPGHHIDGDGLLARRGPREGRRQPQSRPRGWRPTRRQAPRPGHPHLRRGDRHGGSVRSIVKIIY